MFCTQLASSIMMAGWSTFSMGRVLISNRGNGGGVSRGPM